MVFATSGSPPSDFMVPALTANLPLYVPTTVHSLVPICSVTISYTTKIEMTGCLYWDIVIPSNMTEFQSEGDTKP